MVTFKYTHMVTPRIRNPFFAENFVLKGGGGTPLTAKIGKVVFDVLPKGNQGKLLFLFGFFFIGFLRRKTPRVRSNEERQMHL